MSAERDPANARPDSASTSAGGGNEQRRQELSPPKWTTGGLLMGFRPDFLASLDGATGVAYRGEPTASELALLQWRMSEVEQREFFGTISRIMGELRAVDEERLETMLVELNEAADRAPAGDSLEILTEDPDGSRDAFLVWDERSA